MEDEMGRPDDHQQQEIEDLKRELAEQKKLIEANKAAQIPPTADQESAANKLLRATTEAMEKGEIDEAERLLAEINEKYSQTRAAKASERVATELAVMGKPAMPLNVEKWFQGEAKIDEGKATLLVFWEAWCPHCQREVPNIQAMYEEHGPRGLQVVGLTKQSRNATAADVTTFLQERGVTYPIAKEDGNQSEHYAVRGVPAVAVIKDDKVVWRGHPARISPEMLKGWVGP